MCECTSVLNARCMWAHSHAVPAMKQLKIAPSAICLTITAGKASCAPHCLHEGEGEESEDRRGEGIGGEASIHHPLVPQHLRQSSA